MYCTSCGKHNPINSKFCQVCGAKMGDASSGTQSQDAPKDDETVDEAPKSKVDLLWEKFVEVYDAKDEERRKFNALSSPYIWELIERLCLNGFESFIKENSDELNKQPYKTIEGLKELYRLAVVGGYRLKIAESLYQEEKLGKFKSFNIDKFVDEWKKYDFDKAFKAISNDMGICITRYNEFRVNGFMEANTQAKEISNATVEKLKGSVLMQTLNGYHAGKIEDSFRK